MTEVMVWTKDKETGFVHEDATDYRIEPCGALTVFGLGRSYTYASGRWTDVEKRPAR